MLHVVHVLSLTQLCFCAQMTAWRESPSQQNHATHYGLMAVQMDQEAAAGRESAMEQMKEFIACA